MKLNKDELNLLKEVVSLLTAPFHEAAVQTFVRGWAADNQLELTEDEHGNLVLEYAGDGTAAQKPWVLQAHMDHPGFELIRGCGKRALAWFRGGVQPLFFKGARMEFFPAGAEAVPGTVRHVRRDAKTGFLLCRIELDAAVELPEKSFGMWALPAWKLEASNLQVRVADDLSGVAAILLTLARLKAIGAGRPCLALLTRAEEVGFVGALAAAEAGTIRKDWPVLGIECSKEQPVARLGEGAVVRVGDRSTVFDPQLTAILRSTARELKDFKYSEALMPGGSCESTGLSLMGYRTCAVCLPLGNYHNMGAGGQIAPEQIDLGDFEGLIALLTAVVQHDPERDDRLNLKERLLDRQIGLQALL